MSIKPVNSKPLNMPTAKKMLLGYIPICLHHDDHTIGQSGLTEWSLNTVSLLRGVLKPFPTHLTAPSGVGRTKFNWKRT